MFGSLGMPELVIIFVIALIVFGPRKLPELGKSLGKSLAEFKRASNELRNSLEEEIRVEEERERTPKPAPAPAVVAAPVADATVAAPPGRRRRVERPVRRRVLRPRPGRAAVAGRRDHAARREPVSPGHWSAHPHVPVPRPRCSPAAAPIR